MSASPIPSAAGKVTRRRAAPSILEDGEPLQRADTAQIPGIADPIGKTMAFRDHTGQPQHRPPPINQRTKQMLHCPARRARNHGNGPDDAVHRAPHFFATLAQAAYRHPHMTRSHQMARYSFITSL